MDVEKRFYFYEKIVDEFGFSKKKDHESAYILNEYLKEPKLYQLKKIIEKKEVNIFGAGPSLESLAAIPNGVNIAADGACSFLLENDVVPDVVVTDLDGKIDDILEADRNGAVIILHAHGDNIAKIKRYGKRFVDCYGTTQTASFGNLLNLGGFTDGDRAVYIAEYFTPKRISLFGMDFDSRLGKYSFTKPEDVEKKMKKLKWAKTLVLFLIENSQVEVVWAGRNIKKEL